MEPKGEQQALREGVEQFEESSWRFLIEASKSREREVV